MGDGITDDKPARVPGRANQRWSPSSDFDLAKTESLAVILGGEAKRRPTGAWCSLKLHMPAPTCWRRCWPGCSMAGRSQTNPHRSGFGRQHCFVLEQAGGGLQGQFGAAHEDLRGGIAFQRKLRQQSGFLQLYPADDVFDLVEHGRRGA